MIEEKINYSDNCPVRFFTMSSPKLFFPDFVEKINKSTKAIKVPCKSQSDFSSACTVVQDSQKVYPIKVLLNGELELQDISFDMTKTEENEQSLKFYLFWNVQSQITQDYYMSLETFAKRKQDQTESELSKPLKIWKAIFRRIGDILKNKEKNRTVSSTKFYNTKKWICDGRYYTNIELKINKLEQFTKLRCIFRVFDSNKKPVFINYVSHEKKSYFRLSGQKSKIVFFLERNKEGAFVFSGEHTDMEAQSKYDGQGKML